MNEENNVTETIDDSTDITETAGSFDDGWGDAPEEVEEDGFDMEEPVDEQDDTDEPTEETTEEETAEDADTGTDQQGQEEQPEKSAEKTYTLKGIGGEKTVSEEEYRTFAQKGLDYDGLRADRDKLREENGRLSKSEVFLKELAEQSGFEDVQELIDNTRARIYKDKMLKEGKEVSDFEALHHVQREAAKAAAEAVKPAEKTEEEKRSEDIKAFVKEFPNVKAEQIPASVWEEVGKGGNLAQLYREYVSGEKDAEIKRLKAENERLKIDQKNRERSTGSLKSYGSAAKKDAFDEGWDS